LTWKVLRALRNPPGNDALYWHIVTGDWSAPPPYHTSSFGCSITWLVIAALLYLSMCGRGALSIGIITLFSVVAGSAHGLIAAYQISRKITEIKARRVYDFLCLSPSGECRVNWALCAGCLHRYNAFRLMFMFVMIAAVFTSFHLLSIVLRRVDWTAGEADMVLLSMTAVPLLLVADYAQSLVIAALLGILAPTSTNNSTEARLVAVAGFLTLQTGAYTLWLLLASASAQAANAAYGEAVVLTIASAIAVVIIRELVVAALLHVLARRFDGLPQEWNAEVPFKT
jgi:hypothetical protein